MDDKTAAIPSLKEFKEQQKERSAQSNRTGSMQTKGQMRRSGASRKQAAVKSKSRSSATKGKEVKPSKTSDVRSASKGSKAQRPPLSSSSSSATSDRRVAQRANASYATEKRKPAPAPNTYKREQIEAAAQRKRTTSDPKKTASAQAPKTAEKAKNTKKPKKPLSPRMRRIRNFFVSLSIILAVLLVGVILSLTVLFKTNNINVTGLNGLYNEEDIISASGLTFGTNIFTAPKGRAEERIEKKFPYIEEAEITSSFPDTLNIKITVATPACVVEGLGGYYIVSDKGKVLEVSATDDEAGVPIIEGEGIGKQTRAAGEYIEFESDIVKKALEEVFSAFKEYGCKNITAINIKAEEESFALKYVYDNRIVVYLGLPEEINYKIQAADKIIKEKLDLSGTMIAGDLDVSMCHETTKSYFNQYSLLAPQQITPTTAPTEAATEPEVQEYYEEEEYYEDSEETYEEPVEENVDSEEYYDESLEDSE